MDKTGLLILMKLFPLWSTINCPGENVMRVIALTGKAVTVGDNCMITMYHTVDHYKLKCS